jgi:hypothetical protein
VLYLGAAQTNPVAKVLGASPSGLGAAGPDEPDSGLVPAALCQPGEDTSTRAIDSRQSHNAMQDTATGTDVGVAGGTRATPRTMDISRQDDGGAKPSSSSDLRIFYEFSCPREGAHPTTRLLSGIRKPKVYTNDTIRYGCFTSTGEPQNLP